MPATTPFHPGESAVQTRMGVREQIEPFARQVVRSFMPDQHRSFYASLPFMVAAARDRAGRPWATLLAGEVGFISTPDPQQLRIHAGLTAGDALQDSLAEGADLGLLGIEFATRRRNRVNGRVARSDEHGLLVSVDQSFGNCPQYIHPRDWVPAPADVQPEARRLDHLSREQMDWIEKADTFFIASGHRDEGAEPFFGMDASHRGGDPGFVTAKDQRTLMFPDYAGNNHFNTIGNLVLDPRVGLLFVDFTQGHLLQLTGRARIDWDSPAVAEIPGARRLVEITIEDGVELRNVLPIRWTSNGSAARSLRVTQKLRESADVVSVFLEARDGGDLPDFEPGQHLPIQVSIPGLDQRFDRTYSLSAAPGPKVYRLTVKREDKGQVSRFLHDVLQEGDILNAHPPAGEFVLQPGARPVVLLSAGVGLTPMTSMLGVLTRPEEKRPVWFVHGARDGAHHPLAAEVRLAAQGNPRVHAHRVYSKPRPDDLNGQDYDYVGHIDMGLLEAILPTLDADFYLCGPVPFMVAIQDGLVARDVPPEQIHRETFGPLGEVVDGVKEAS